MRKTVPEGQVKMNTFLKWMEWIYDCNPFWNYHASFVDMTLKGAGINDLTIYIFSHNCMRNISSKKFKYICSQEEP